MSKTNKVSVLLTSYNHAKYLREAIKSVLDQTFIDFELIIWDDASTDESWGIIRGFSDSRIRSFRSETNNVMGNIRTTISELAVGEYIAVHHSDDIWETQKLEKQVAFLDDHPGIGAVFSRALIIGENGEPFEDLSHSYYKIFDQPNRTRHEWLNYFFYHGNALCHPSVLIRKVCYNDCGLYRYGLAQLPDFDMWVRLCIKYDIHILPEKLVRFRVRANEANTSGNRPETHIRTQFEFLQILNNYLEITDRNEFVKIFPDSLEYFKQDQYDIGFALAMSALKSEYNFSKLFGLRQLWEILNNENRAKKIKDMYGFSNHQFIALTAENDVFSFKKIFELSNQLNEQNTNVQTLSAQLNEQSRKAQMLSTQLTEILISKEWKIVLLFRRISAFLVPPGSRRARVIQVVLFPLMKIREAQETMRNIALIKSSGLFDKNWYLTYNHDVTQSKVNPLLHYLHVGGFEGRDPGPNFSSSLYLNTYEDVKKTKTNPLVHYLKYGRKEERVSQLVQTHTVNSVKLSGDSSLKESRLSRFVPIMKWIPLKEIARKILVKTKIWLSSHPTIKNLIKPFLPSRVRGKLNRVIQVVNPYSSDFSNTGTTDWDNYLQLSQQIHSINQARLSSIMPKPFQMINLNEKNLLQAAQSLKIVKQENPEVSIIIPVHNNAKLTMECLTAITQCTDETAYEIIIVDDGSDSDTVEILQAINNISLIRHNERAGFTCSCNQGANAARANYLLILNNDTQVMKGWLKALLDVFAKGDRVGAVGPKVLFPDGHLQEAGCIINRDGTTELVGFMDDPSLPRYNFIREVDYCSGVSLMVNANVFREIGGFDELYSPAYYEDVDLCFKLRARGLKIFYCPDAAVIHHLSATANKIEANFKLQLAARNRQKILERWQETLDKLNQVKLIAFYLPQYHPVPENDLWWGKGFTEWANVARALPNYKGHYQPHIPADLGFYDLRVPEVMEQQVEMAKRYNIYGFCYYYYWFSGKRILEMPLERILETGKPDFPFCLCWANENWSRRWDGSENDILLAQSHSDQDDKAVILDLIRYLHHPNYIRINGKPIILIYRIGIFPDIQRTTHIWREVCRQENMGEIHLVMVESFEHSLMGVDPHEYGLDATIEFPPHNMATPGNAPGVMINPNFSGGIFNYRNETLKYVNKEIPSHTHYNTVMPSWDNTARKQNNSFIFDQATPGDYQAWLEAALQKTREQLGSDQRILFINAWNEWAEGNHLEPDQRYGHRYLEATRNAQERFLLKRGPRESE